MICEQNELILMFQPRSLASACGFLALSRLFWIPAKTVPTKTWLATNSTSAFHSTSPLSLLHPHLKFLAKYLYRDNFVSKSSICAERDFRVDWLLTLESTPKSRPSISTSGIHTHLPVAFHSTEPIRYLFIQRNMAPPPNASLPLTKRLEQLATTLQ